MPVSRAFADSPLAGSGRLGPERGTAPRPPRSGTAQPGPLLARARRGPPLCLHAGRQARRTRGTGPLSRLGLGGGTGRRAQDAAAARRDSAMPRRAGLWNHLTHAMRGLRMGAPGSPDSGMAAAFQNRAALCRRRFQHARYCSRRAWRRRNDELERCRAALYRFDRTSSAAASASRCPPSPRWPTWCGWERYARGDTAAARAELDSWPRRALRPVLRYNPRVRFEYLNLGALLHKHDAIAATQPAPSGARQPRRRSTAGAGRAGGPCRLSRALQAAYGGRLGGSRAACRGQPRLVPVAVLAARPDRW